MSSNLLIENATNQDNGLYRCAVSSACGDVQSEERSLVVCGPPGDLDCNEVVSISDLATLPAHFAMSDGGEVADLNGDGVVSLADLAILLAHFGTTCP